IGPCTAVSSPLKSMGLGCILNLTNLADLDDGKAGGDTQEHRAEKDRFRGLMAVGQRQAKAIGDKWDRITEENPGFRRQAGDEKGGSGEKKQARPECVETDVVLPGPDDKQEKLNGKGDANPKSVAG